MTAEPKTWLITGASRGVGRSLALAALAAGHHVVATVRGEHDLPGHDRLVVHPLDVTERDGAAGAVQAAVDAFGSLDVLVNNAGHGLIGAVEEVSETEARRIVDTDLLGAVWLTQAALPVMRAQASGHVLQISTTGAVGTMPTLGLYNAAKWGLEGFSEALAGEVRGFGIRVTIAELGQVDTAWGTSSMRFAEPDPAYDDLRASIFGSPVVPWPDTGETGGGTSPDDVAAVLLQHVDSPADDRLRLLVGDDAHLQARGALQMRLEDYRHDERFGGPI